MEQLHVETITTKWFRQEFQIYPWIKSRIFHKVIMGDEVLQRKDASVFRTQFRSLFYGFFSFFRKYDAWAFTNSSERILLNGKQFDKLMDPITNACKMRMLVVELQLFKQFKRKEVASKYVVSRAWIVFFEELYTRIFLRKVKISGEATIREVEEILQDKVDVKQIVRKYLAQYRVMKGVLWLLPRPKVIFLTVSYANFGYIRAWKEAGIRVVEMQHGLIGNGHYGYIYHKPFNTNQFPDSVLVFGARDQELIQNHSVFQSKILPVGRYLLDYFKKRQSLIKHRFALSWFRFKIHIGVKHFYSSFLRWIEWCPVDSIGSFNHGELRSQCTDNNSIFRRTWFSQGQMYMKQWVRRMRT